MSSSWAEFDFGTTSSSSTSPPNNSSSSNHNYRLSSAMSGGGGGKARGSWEDLRKEARQLENQIDMKLVSFSKIGSSMGSSGGSSTSASAASSSDKQPLLSADAVNPSEQFASMTAEIDSFLNRLSHINEGMTEYAAGQPQSAAIHHTLQRHRDILQDYRQEFLKTKSRIGSLLDREDLLSSVHRDINDYRQLSGGQNKRMDILLKESEHARNSERMLDEQISIAVETRESLVNQRVAFKAIQTKLNDISNRFPMINSLVQKVNLRKRRDSIILGSVIGLCFVFLLWYTFG